jgi:hypothetical protein
MTAPENPTERPTSITLAEAVRVLERERSAAEQYAVILDRHGKGDTGRYVQGITRYAEAKADFDGLIEALKTNLIQGRDPTSSLELGEALRVAAEKRIAFTSLVEQVIGDSEGARGWVYDAVRVVPDLVRALTEAGIGIWREFRGAGKARRDEILDQLDHLKWRPFADIAQT